MKYRLLRHLVILGLLALPLGGAHAQSVEDTIADRAAAHGQGGTALVGLARCESGLNPRAVGRAGELGLFQLHPDGLLPLFYAQGYRDPLDVWEASDFTAWALRQGLAAHWSCTR